MWYWWLQLLNDPQGFSEKLFQRIQGATTHRFETKVLILGVVSRVIATHKLQVSVESTQYAPAPHILATCSRERHPKAVW